MASENLLYDRGTPKLVFCDNSEGWDGEGGLRGRGHKGKKKKKEGEDTCIPTVNSC